nr:MAG TPA: hypothetical protein [Caudoviricetes sp.]
MSFQPQEKLRAKKTSRYGAKFRLVSFVLGDYSLYHRRSFVKRFFAAVFYAERDGIKKTLDKNT